MTCVDVDQAKVDALHAGEVPIYEPYLERTAGARGRPNLSFTTDVRGGASPAPMWSSSPSAPRRCPTAARTCATCARPRESIGENLDDGFTVVVNKSTVPIGSGNWVDAIVRDAYEQRPRANARRDFAVASNPEFLREGAAIGDTLYPDRVVIGSDDPRSARCAQPLYRPILDQSFTPPAFLPRPEDMAAVPLVSTDLASAELIKYAANAFLALKISYINEIGQLAERVGADISAGRARHRPGRPDRYRGSCSAGIGWGGSCFGKDTAALMATADEYKLDMPIVDGRPRGQPAPARPGRREAAGRAAHPQGPHDRHPGPRVQAEHRRPARLPRRSTSPSRLIDRGARVRLHDPVAMGRRPASTRNWPRYLRDDRLDEVVTGSDAVVLVTEWSQYLQLDWGKLAPLMRTPILLDGRHALDRHRLHRRRVPLHRPRGLEPRLLSRGRHRQVRATGRWTRLTASDSPRCAAGGSSATQTASILRNRAARTGRG